ncbi:hypothetical protein GGTG_13994 [Gaeumannomyces tritici R3-111a-1]|uniref:Uncharacterized protein n=1 Tax=Gaeumannomyces tritici (strain R3-111a-1) TaxID=644352 RepID=J3PKE0_GAET3|nr:hypothetical protein GGTG_13994 [Gaeumannomyces tritici R3-111a-1]EJT68429.1 hypothetical protein GGTG_13994 [Gaeumannomyces tritici R3-111a-1]
MGSRRPAGGGGKPGDGMTGGFGREEIAGGGMSRRERWEETWKRTIHQRWQAVSGCVCPFRGGFRPHAPASRPLGPPRFLDKHPGSKKKSGPPSRAGHPGTSAGRLVRSEGACQGGGRAQDGVPPSTQGSRREGAGGRDSVARLGSSVQYMPSTRSFQKERPSCPKWSQQGRAITPVATAAQGLVLGGHGTFVSLFRVMWTKEKLAGSRKVG